MRKANAAVAGAAAASARVRRLVLFDLDDTLCDYVAARTERLRRAFGAFLPPEVRSAPGFDLDRMVACSIAQQPHGADHFANLFAQFGVVSPEPARLARAWYESNRFLGLALYPETTTLISEIRALPCWSPTIGVITNGPARVQRDKVLLLGVDGLADFVIISGEFGSAKPDPAIFREALRQGGVDRDEAVMIGDSLAHDVVGAQAVGMRSVWFNPDGRQLRAGEVQPTHEVHGLLEIPDLLAIWGPCPTPIQRGSTVDRW